MGIRYNVRQIPLEDFQEMANRNITVGLLHPGEMGVTVSATVVAGGTRVVWASEGRSALTESRALEAGLEDGGSLALVVRQSRVILSVVPPHGALALAQSVAALDFRGLYLDGNAVSPDTAREIGWVIETAGGRFVDGGIIGPAARRRGPTRRYLSGSPATHTALPFTPAPLRASAAPRGSTSQGPRLRSSPSSSTRARWMRSCSTRPLGRPRR